MLKSLQDKILDRQALARWAEKLRTEGKTLVSTNGCFDILHSGHVSYLARARDLGDYLVVGINSDASVKKLKGPDRPVNQEKDRAFVLSALACVDAVCIFDEATPVEFLKAFKPQIHVKGGDYEAAKIPETAALAQWQGRVEILPFLEGYSTTDIIKRSGKCHT
jgi:rfaE bifunctional protein nucleotidyltransferase chain/domain